MAGFMQQVRVGRARRIAQRAAGDADAGHEPDRGVILDHGQADRAETGNGDRQCWILHVVEPPALGRAHSRARRRCSGAGAGNTPPDLECI